MKTADASVESRNAAPVDRPGRVERLRALSLRALPRMYDASRKRFVFCMRRSGDAVSPEGLSIRYTAITLIGLAGEDRSDVHDVLHGHTVTDVCGSLLDELESMEHIGDVALTVWAAVATGHPDVSRARAYLEQRVQKTNSAPTVELAWVLTALSLGVSDGVSEDVLTRAAMLVQSAFEPECGLFRHMVGPRSGLRSHVACFADLVYPVQALAHYHQVSNDREALRIAERCGRAMCELQGLDGQWWWHFDARTGKTLEGYPVYAVHQDAMAPMALFALADAGGTLYGDAIERGLTWLDAARELGGGTLVDETTGVVWRKVARREPRKMVRGMQALAARVHPAMRVPGVGVAFPPGTIDYECRPYHLGWLLYCWPQARAASWDTARRRA